MLRQALSRGSERRQYGVAFDVIARIQNGGPGPAISLELSMTYIGEYELLGNPVQDGFVSTLLHGTDLPGHLQVG
jgi:hypothetical protein